MNRVMLIGGLASLAVVVAVAVTVRHHNPSGPARSSVSARLSPAFPSNDTTLNSTRAVGSTARMRVGPLTWRVVSAHRSRRIQNEYLDATAVGVYLILELAATNDTGGAVLPGSDRVSLKIGRVDYRPDPTSLGSLELAGLKSIPETALGPARTTSGWIAFDVPLSVGDSPAAVCFDELATGSGERCLAIP